LCRGGPCNQERASERIGKAHFPARGFKADAAPLAFSRLSFNIPSFSQRNAGTEPVQNPYSEYSGTRNIGKYSVNGILSVSSNDPNDVACLYLARSDSKRNSIYTRLWIIMDEAKANLRAPMPLRQLAEITDFNLFLTTTFRLAHGIGAQ
jgi:hypothetical protein